MSESERHHHEPTPPRNDDIEVAAEGLYARSEGVKVALGVWTKARKMDEALRQGTEEPSRQFVVRVEVGGLMSAQDYPFAHDTVLLRPTRQSARVWGTDHAIMLRLGLSQRHPTQGLQPNEQVVLTHEHGGERDKTLLLNDLVYGVVTDPRQFKVVSEGTYQELQGAQGELEQEEFNPDEFKAMLEDFEPTLHLPPQFYKAS